MFYSRFVQNENEPSIAFPANTTETLVSGLHTGLSIILVLSASIILLRFGLHRFTSADSLPIVNRTFAWEPRVFARFRWALRSEQILDAAYKEFPDQIYRLDRGDTDVIVLPSSFIQELNKSPLGTLNSRMSHAFSLTGNLNGMNVVIPSNHHVKMLLNRVTPALPEFLKTASVQVEETLGNLLPQDKNSWTTICPLNPIVFCVARTIALVTFGHPICDDPDLVRLCCDHTRNIFAIMFVMRFVPAFLQPLLVWLTPDKWRLIRSSKKFESFVVPEIKRRMSGKNQEVSQDLISWMIREPKDEQSVDISQLTALVATVVAGGTYSTAAFIVGLIVDLTSHPQFLEEIREEIRTTNEKIGGKWDMAAFNSLDKLDSAMKETLRMAPGSLLAYSRVLQKEYTISTGLTFKKGEKITVAGHPQAMDPRFYSNPFEYNALRSYNENLRDHRDKPFRSIEGEDLRWGAGRWACPGRYTASIMSKAILVKLLDEYEFRFVGEKPQGMVLHEFGFFHPDTPLMVRRRHLNSGIKYE